MSPAPVSNTAPHLGVEPPEALVRHQGVIRAALRSSLEWGPPALRTVLHYHLGWVDRDGAPTTGASGKALRPALCLFTCESVGGAVERAVPAAVALELVHNFSLVHDDIQDEDRERRHRPTVWAVWGKPLALMVGNAVHTLANVALEGLLHGGATPAVALATAETLTGRCLEMIEGQYLDLTFEGREDVTPEEYLDMVSKKTGALIDAATYMGASLGGAEPVAASALGRAGRLLGLAFQARDDLLGIWGDAAVIGKPTGADIRRKKKSLPVVYGFHRAGAERRGRLERLYRSGDMDDAAVSEVMETLEGLGAREYTQSVAEGKCREALALVQGAVPGQEAKAAFEQLVDFVLHRQR